MNTEWYLDHLEADTERFARVLETGPTDAPVAACPGWDVTRLAEHLGHIHRWAEFCARHARPPTEDDEPIEPFDPVGSADWLRDGSRRLADTLRGLDPTAPTWHPFPIDPVVAVWPRRQAHETAMHRWDAETAVGADATIDAALASDGIDEYFELAIPRLVQREGIELPSGSLHVHCTDVDGEWVVSADGTGYHLRRTHERADAAVRGAAASILLALWGRRDVSSSALERVGDDQVLDAWLTIAGM